ncbi:major facilitator superfamily domain-containing protein [Bisporella sp. PMI_857]|nr:major facilitator superfamily domain-containing protein [Bisporella sp. PMI_857]
MWSYVQYRSIGKLVERETTRQFYRNNDHTLRSEKDASAASGSRRGSVQTRRFKLEGNSHLSNREQLEKGNDLTNKQYGIISIDVSGEDDPIDPRNWSLLSRCKNIAILSFLIFVQAWAGSAGSMANTAASKEFGVGKIAENLSTAMYLFGVGAGSLFIGPLSETVGRNPTYLVSTLIYMLFVLGSALTPSFGGQIICRFFVGLFSSATLAVNGSSVRDQFRPVKRAFVFPVIAWANVAAPAIAPIPAGWIVSNTHLGWRWTEWMTLVISGAAFIIALFFLPETYLPILLDWKAKHLRRVTGDLRYTSEHSSSASLLRKFKQVTVLQGKFIRTEPVIDVLGAYLILLYIILFSLQSGFDYIFKETYRLSVGLTGSCFAAIATGSTAFTAFAPGLYSWACWKTEHVRGSSIKPEFRLWPAIVTAPLLPASLFWLGWSNDPSISIWCGLGACFVFGVVMIAIYVSSYEYIIDSYDDHAAVALATVTMIRYFVAGGMVMATRPMYEAIGVQWSLTLLGCIAAILVPAPLVFWRYGAKIRSKSLYAKGDVDDEQ